MVDNVHGSYTYTSWRKGHEEETSSDILAWNNFYNEKEDVTSLG